MIIVHRRDTISVALISSGRRTIGIYNQGPNIQNPGKQLNHLSLQTIAKVTKILGAYENLTAAELFAGTKCCDSSGDCVQF